MPTRENPGDFTDSSVKIREIKWVLENLIKHSYNQDPRN